MLYTMYSSFQAFSNFSSCCKYIQRKAEANCSLDFVKSFLRSNLLSPFPLLPLWRFPLFSSPPSPLGDRDFITYF